MNLNDDPIDLNDAGESFTSPPPSPRRARVGDVHRPRLITELPREVIPHITQHLTLSNANRLRLTSRNDLGIPEYTNNRNPLVRHATPVELEHIITGIQRPTIDGRLVSGPLQRIKGRGHTLDYVVPMVPSADHKLVGGFSRGGAPPNRPSPMTQQHPNMQKLLRRVGYMPPV